MVVVVDDKPYPMHIASSSSLLFSGSAPHPEKGYHYAKVDSTGNILENEPFDRKPFEGDATPNEHYNRTWNTWKIPQLLQVLDPLPAIHRVDSKLHIDGEIPTIHITGDDQAIQNMHKHDKDDIQVNTTMTYISLHDVQTFSGVEFEISGRFSREASKLAYNLKLPKKTYLYGYRRLKLRSLATDPSYIREDLGYKMLAAAGVPTTDTSYVRVYLNNQPLGLFGFIEKFKNPWLRNEFADGNKDYQQGTLYQGKYTNPKAELLGGRVSDLSYYGDKEGPYALGEYKIAEDPSEGEPNYKALIELTKFLDKAPSTKEAWEAHFDMESVLRGMALEFLLGFADGYLTVADNYYVYQTSPNSTKFIFMLWDIDLSLGSTSLIEMSQIEAGDWHKFTSSVTKRPLMKFLQVPEYANRFDQLIQELNDKLMTPDVLGQRIDETAAMLKEDVEWDKSCPRVSSVGLLNYNDMAVLAHAFGFMKTVDVSMHTVHDFNQRQRHDDVDFMNAVNGPTGYKHSLVGLKEFIKVKHQNVADHYDNEQK
ncbi:hypothetical protein O0I10_000239 [Lichtheimia ornata]|uniref:Spore coat protein CotH n=1 Tax=Lichtheimia ornata TaxID=688661 RepID=A0AAD7Y567_9FUNG|nr:uncharacterized protein O0I10_000239 [Lichtheimia ornata]KAJ8663964.1 hypothetical protein O0I10_000239 [Lichtheimia ornata]